MEIVRPEFAPDPNQDRAALEAEQRTIARTARYEPPPEFDSTRFRIEESVPTTVEPAADGDRPVVVGIDQAFSDDAAVSAAIAIRDGVVIEVATGSAALELPYIPGLLAYREAVAIVDALTELVVDPDLLVFDGSGRIHYRQAGIATHVGVLFDAPAIGVAKNLLCGHPVDDLDTPLRAGADVRITADDTVERLDATDADWPVIGAAYQSRQYPNPETRHVNPLYVSPGHDLDVATVVDTVAELCVAHKLPEPVRVADQVVDQTVAED